MPRGGTECKQAAVDGAHSLGRAGLFARHKQGGANTGEQETKAHGVHPDRKGTQRV